MTTCRQVINGALRKCRVIGSGDTPTADEANDALTSLQSLYDGWANYGVFGRLTDVIATESGPAREYTRVRYTTGLTITLPTEVTPTNYDYGFPMDPYDYGFNSSSEPRPPLNRAQIVLVNMDTQARSVNLYDANKGIWIDLLGIGLDDDAPLSELDADGLSAVLAADIADDFGATVSGSTQRKAGMFQSLLSHRFDATRRETQTEYY